jgi:hypothetical protein
VTSDDRSDWSAPLLALMELQRHAERGPKREGAFALWLVVRLALDVRSAAEVPDKGLRRRVALVAQRVGSLAVARPLSRGLTTALAHLQEATTAGARIAMAQLVAPARDALGSEAADAVALAARMVHERRDVTL